MSGEAGASIAGELYSLFLGSGVNVDVHVPEGDDGSAIGNYFAAESAQYERWLARAAADLEALFAEVRAAGTLPLVAVRQPCEQIDGTIIHDEDDYIHGRHFARFHRGGPLALGVRGHLPDLQTVNISVAVTGRVHRRDLDELLARVTAVLVRHAADPPPPPPPPPPEPPPRPENWPSRLRRWLFRG